MYLRDTMFRDELISPHSLCGTLAVFYDHGYKLGSLKMEYC